MWKEEGDINTINPTNVDVKGKSFLQPAWTNRREASVSGLMNTKKKEHSLEKFVPQFKYHGAEWHGYRIVNGQRSQIKYLIAFFIPMWKTDKQYIKTL